MTEDDIKEVVAKVREAARTSAPGSSCCGDGEWGCDPITTNLYDDDETGSYRKTRCWPRSAAAIRPRSPN